MSSYRLIARRAVEPGAFLPGGELDIDAGPADRPGVLVVEPVEPGAALPVVPGQLQRVVHAQAALLVGGGQARPGPHRR